MTQRARKWREWALMMRFDSESTDHKSSAAPCGGVFMAVTVETEDRESIKVADLAKLKKETQNDVRCRLSLESSMWSIWLRHVVVLCFWMGMIRCVSLLGWEGMDRWVNSNKWSLKAFVHKSVTKYKIFKIFMYFYLIKFQTFILN